MTKTTETKQAFTPPPFAKKPETQEAQPKITVATNPPLAATLNPFKAKPSAPKPSAPIVFAKPAGTPAWSDFVRFVQKHSAVIDRARYPGPMGDGVIQTIYRGVPVENFESVQIHHMQGGWVDFAVASV